MNVRTLATRLIFALVPVVAACGAAQPAPDSVPTPTSTASAPAAPSAIPSAAPTGAAPTVPAPPTASAAAWKDLSREQRMDVMKKVVMPKMKAEFAAFDGKQFGDIGCATCHGDGAKAGNFKMPNPALPKLSVADRFKKHMDKSPEMTKFMMSKVTPGMAGMLGEQPYDPKTHEGFGCFGCHTMEK